MPPIFILSCERSGSTLLRYIVDTHPDICSPGQLYIGQLCESLFRTTYFSIGVATPADSEEERRRMVVGEVRRVVENLLERYAQAKNKRMWCDKTTMNLEHLRVLDEVFGDARCICLYRNCMDVVYSIIECSRTGFMPELARYVKRNPENLVAAMVEAWVEKNTKLLEFESRNGARCFRVKYESLVLNPAATLPRMFAFLGVEWSAGLLEKVFTAPHDAGSGDTKILFSKKINKNSVGRGSGLSRGLIPAELLERMNGLLEKLDYPVVGEDWDDAPSPYLPASDVGGDDVVARVEDVFAGYFPGIIAARRERAAEIDGVCKFVVNGEGGGIWLLNFKEPLGEILAGGGEASCTIILSSEDLMDIVRGKQNAITAFDGGRIKVTGDVEQANKIGQLLFGG